MREIALTVVGAGPRALNIIERLAWKLKVDPDLPGILVNLVDPGTPGAGVHSATQPLYLLTNTLASQVTMFSSVNPDDPDSGPSGPSFTEWARANGYRRVGSSFQREHEGYGEEISDLDYLPRAMLGEYLTFCFGLIVGNAPSRIRVVHHRQLAVDMTAEPPTIHLDDGTALVSDGVVVATGHCETRPSPQDAEREAFASKNSGRNPKLAYFRNVYPIKKLASILPGSTIAVQGLGLTAYDVIAELTAGRGGSFESGGNALRYVASGNEPKILLFSRQSLPYSARGVNEKGIQGGYSANFLTAAAVNAMRARKYEATGERRLDFLKDIVPLIRMEMAYAYRRSHESTNVDPQGFEMTESEERIIDEILAPSTLLQCSDMASFKANAMSFLRADLAEARRGNVSSPLKAATDSIRDLRAGLAAAIEFGGLLPQSHRFVCEDFIALTNRITFGPPLARNAELIALIEAGIVDWAGGPSASIELDAEAGRFVVTTRFANGATRIGADALLVARVFGHRPNEDERSFSRKLVERGIARPFRNVDYQPYGIDIDRRMRVLRVDGKPNDALWAVGYVTEGARFHTHALPRPGRPSTQLSDAALIVDDIFRTFGSRSQTVRIPGARESEQSSVGAVADL